MSNDNCVSITTAFNHNCSITTAFNHTAATPLTLRALAGVNDRTHPASTASTLGDIAIQASAIRDRAAPMIVPTRRKSGILANKEDKPDDGDHLPVAPRSRLPTRRSGHHPFVDRVTAIARDRPRAIEICSPCVIGVRQSFGDHHSPRRGRTTRCSLTGHRRSSLIDGWEPTNRLRESPASGAERLDGIRQVRRRHPNSRKNAGGGRSGGTRHSATAEFGDIRPGHCRGGYRTTECWSRAAPALATEESWSTDGSRVHHACLPDPAG